RGRQKRRGSGARPERGDVAVLRDAWSGNPRRGRRRGASARRNSAGRAAIGWITSMSQPDPNFERLLEFVRDDRGFDSSGYRRPTLIRRFEKRRQAVGVDDWDGYRAYLAEHPEEFSELFNTILINVTGFFRDRETWDLVASEIIPRLLDERP